MKQNWIIPCVFFCLIIAMLLLYNFTDALKTPSGGWWVSSQWQISNDWTIAGATPSSFDYIRAGIFQTAIGIVGLFLVYCLFVYGSSNSWKYSFFFSGVFLGLFINDFLSPSFLANVIINKTYFQFFGPLLELSAACFLSALFVKRLEKEFSRIKTETIKTRKKRFVIGNYISIGAATISGITAAIFFVQVLIAWIPNSQAGGVAISFVQTNLENIVIIVESLFVSAQFLIFDSVLKLIEKS
jgi:hypothetical protein